MFRNRRFACLFLGLWLGASGAVDLLVTQSFPAVEAFISAPGSPTAKAQIKQAGEKTARFILRRNATEQEGRIFGLWEWMQFGIAGVFFFIVLLGDRPPKSAVVVLLIMMAILLLQHFLVTPNMVSLERDVDEIPASELAQNSTVTQFAVFRGLYWGCEILKYLLGLGVGARLMIRRTNERSQREQDRESAGARSTADAPASERRIRKRRKTTHDG